MEIHIYWNGASSVKEEETLFLKKSTELEIGRIRRLSHSEQLLRKYTKWSD